MIAKSEKLKRSKMGCDNWNADCPECGCIFYLFDKEVIKHGKPRPEAKP